MLQFCNNSRELEFEPIVKAKAWSMEWKKIEIWDTNDYEHTIDQFINIVQTFPSVFVKLFRKNTTKFWQG